MQNSTRLRYLTSKDKDILSEAVESLPFKVEIKGAPILENKKWVIWFVLPEDDIPQVKKFRSMELD